MDYALPRAQKVTLGRVERIERPCYPGLTPWASSLPPCGLATEAFRKEFEGETKKP
jgi:hypothetical protein